MEEVESLPTDDKESPPPAKEMKILPLKQELQSLSIDDKQYPVYQYKGDNSTLLAAFELGNDELIQDFLNDCKVTLNENDLEILLNKCIENKNVSIVNRLVMNKIDIHICLQNCQSVLNKSEGINLKNYFLVITENNKLSFAKLILEENIEFLHQFVESETDINTTDAKGLSCLQHVLKDRDERLETVKYLVEHGADVNSVLPSGSPCLLEAANRHHFKICEYLISKGANVHCRNSRQKTMLHLVSRKSRFYDTVSVAKLLVRAGADVNVVDDRNLTPIQIAAIEYNQRAVDYLASLDHVTTSSKISAFQVIGAIFSSKDTAIKYWTKALILIPDKISDDDKIHVDGNAILPGVKELQSVEHVKEVAGNEESRLFQSVYLLDKILGRHNLNTLKKLKTLARSYLKTDKGERIGAAVIKHALCKVLQVRRSILKDSASVDALYDIMCCWCYYFKDKTSISFSDISEIFYNLVEQLNILGIKLQTQQSEIPSSSLDLVYEVYNVLFTLEKTPNDVKTFNEINDYFIRVDVKYSQVFGRSIIHTTVQNRIHYFFSAEQGQKYDLTRFLVTSGVSVNTLDRRKNTPLHFVLKESPNYERTKIVKYLLDNGAHVDVRNGVGETPLSLIKDWEVEFYEVKYRTLQCLCAVVIKSHGLLYKDEVPKHIASFIELH